MRITGNSGGNSPKRIRLNLEHNDLRPTQQCLVGIKFLFVLATTFVVDTRETLGLELGVAFLTMVEIHIPSELPHICAYTSSLLAPPAHALLHVCTEWYTQAI